jgi:hypothetical protein
VSIGSTGVKPRGLRGSSERSITILVGELPLAGNGGPIGNETGSHPLHALWTTADRRSRGRKGKSILGRVHWRRPRGHWRSIRLRTSGNIRRQAFGRRTDGGWGTTTRPVDRRICVGRSVLVNIWRERCSRELRGCIGAKCCLWCDRWRTWFRSRTLRRRSCRTRQAGRRRGRYGGRGWR